MYLYYVIRQTVRTIDCIDFTASVLIFFLNTKAVDCLIDFVSLEHGECDDRRKGTGSNKSPEREKW